MNSYIANNENVDLWSKEKCIFCKGKIEEDSKILNCLHIICKDCTDRESTDLGVLCKCKIVTKGELIDYSVVSPNQSQIKICYKKNCQVIAKKICMHCKNMYCKPCSKEHSIENGHHSSALMMTYPLKKEFVPCPECMEKCVEVFCTKCSKMICPLCHLNFHQEHNFKLLSTMSDETYAKLQTLLTVVRKKSCRNYKGNVERKYQKLKFEKKKISDEIDEKFKMLHDEVDKQKFELKKLLETNFTNAVNNIIINKAVIDDFEKEIEYYHSLTSSVMNCDKPIECFKLSRIIMNSISIAPKHIQDISKETTCKSELIYSDEQSMKKCVESIRGMGNITSSTIVNLTEYKITVDSNNILQALENDNENPILKSKPIMIQPDSDSSDYEPLVKLIHCTCCNRFYHNECHIPPLAKELKPNDPSLISWKCTLCQDFLKYFNLRERNMTCHINSFGRKVIERILLELYCQNEDSEHYRDCLNREIYPTYYEKIDNPISLNDIKQRLESDASYTSLFDIIGDLKKVFKNGKSYYSSSDPFNKSAEELQISLERMISLYITPFNLSYLER
ncbi:hypothetical protein QTP88_020209 [Uroleucon formosanum]